MAGCNLKLSFWAGNNEHTPGARDPRAGLLELTISAVVLVCSTSFDSSKANTVQRSQNFSVSFS